GSGIPPEIQSRLVEAFFTTKKKGEGTGLGLAISRNFVASHGGAITRTSEPGKGSTFTVVLPKQAPGVRATEGAAADRSKIGQVFLTVRTTLAGRIERYGMLAMSASDESARSPGVLIVDD